MVPGPGHSLCQFVGRVAMKEFDEEMRKQGVVWTTELEYWAYVDDITMATTAELAPLVMTKLKETLERHGLELRKDKCTAYCPTPERVECIRVEMTQFLKWTLEGLMKLETASDGEYRTEITTEAEKSHEPTDNRLRNARMLPDGIRQVCEADLECTHLAPAWKLVTIVLNNALSFDCCVVPPEAMASYAQELDEIVEALFPLFVGQDRLEPSLSRECVCPRMLVGLMLCRCSSDRRWRKTRSQRGSSSWSASSGNAGDRRSG